MLKDSGSVFWGSDVRGNRTAHCLGVVCLSEDYGLCAWGGVGGEEEVAEDVVEAGDDDAVAGELGVL